MSNSCLESNSKRRESFFLEPGKIKNGSFYSELVLLFLWQHIGGLSKMHFDNNCGLAHKNLSSFALTPQQFYALLYSRIIAGYQGTYSYNMSVSKFPSRICGWPSNQKYKIMEFDWSQTRIHMCSKWKYSQEKVIVICL